MKNMTVKVILVASLAFNIAFVSSAVIRGLSGNGPEETMPPPTDLRLRGEQREKLDTIVKKFRIYLLQFKQDILEKRMDIIEYLGDPELDFESLKTKTDELNQLENQLNLAFVNTLIEINSLLDSRQRINFLLKLSKNWFFMNEEAADRRHR